VLSAFQGQGIGAALMDHLVPRASHQLLVGTWADARWAIAFYQRRGFSLADPAGKDILLERYWTVPPRQREVSVVLVGSGVAAAGSGAPDAD
jgi:N-acetylglutamate synthase-like GNAT family acetyltransferase